MSRFQDTEANTSEHKSYAVAVQGSKATAFERDYKEFNERPYGSTFVYGRRKIERIIEPVLLSFPPGARAVDVGCGTGFNLRRLHDRGFDVTGVEPSVELRSIAAADNPAVQILDGDIENLPLESGTFDLVLVIEVVRYLADPSRALAELARVLRPGGVAIVTVAPRWSLNGYAAVNQVTARVKVPGFTQLRQSFMSERSGIRAMQAAGFSSVEVHGAFVGPWQILGRLAPETLAPALRKWEPLDDTISDRPVLRDLSNHLVLIGRK